jgi:pyrroline-5-carboxylate reductase
MTVHRCGLFRKDLSFICGCATIPAMAELSPANPLLFFGCGNMGGAMLNGWLRAGFDPASFVVIDPGRRNYPDGVRHFAMASELADKVSTAVVAVKPQAFVGLAPQLEPLLDADALVISVMAGVRSEAIKDIFSGRNVIRLMPNLAAAIGKSPLGLFGPAFDAKQRRALETLLAPLGTPVWIDAEADMDVVTALAGSGPAFVYRFIDALAKAGETLGLDRDKAARLAMAMIDGAVDLAVAADVSPAELAQRVTSPGGTTAAGLGVLDRNAALDELINATLEAARDRGIELSGG